MKEILPIVEQYCQTANLTFSPAFGEELVRYAEFLVAYNQKVNLTAITTPADIAVKHFVDSLTLLTAVQPVGRLLDVGTGAGFPGMVMKLAYPQLNVTLMDSTGKKIEFLRQLAEHLHVKVDLLCGRAEDFAHQKGLRESFDVVTARAVAALPVLCEYCLPFVKMGGRFVAMKGSEFREELSSAGAAISKLGGKTEKVVPCILPDESNRGLIVVQKISQTPSSFPRNGAQIAKKAL